MSLEAIKEHTRDLLYYIVFIVALFLLNPAFDYLGINNEFIKNLLTLFITLIFFITVYSITSPKIEFILPYKERKILLRKDKVEKRATDVYLYVDIKKSLVSKRLFNFLCHKYGEQLHYQLYCFF